MMRKAMIHVDITVESPAWETIQTDWESLIRTSAQKTFEKLGFQNNGVELSIVLADDPFIQDLNKQYRDKDSPTNVLSFPQFEPEELETLEGTIPLGDMIFAFETIAREAGEQEKSFTDHTTHLIVHSILHLLGYDHEEEEAAEEMENLEVSILCEMGVKNPYESDGQIQKIMP